MAMMLRRPDTRSKPKSTSWPSEVIWSKTPIARGDPHLALHRVYRANRGTRAADSGADFGTIE